MIIVDANEVASDLGSFLRRVKKGETLIIAIENRPVAELRPAIAPIVSARPFGLCAGEFIVPHDFDTPLPEDLLSDFEDR